MIDPDQRLFADTLACDDAFPWTLRAAAPGESTDAARRSESALRALGSLDDARAADDPDADALPPRIEAKLDLVLALLTTLIARSDAPAPPQPLRWSRHGMRLEAPAPWTVDSHAIVSARLLPGSPLPIDLPARVIACRPRDGGYVVWLAFPDHAPGLRAAIERELFRRHRRIVQEQRLARA